MRQCPHGKQNCWTCFLEEWDRAQKDRPQYLKLARELKRRDRERMIATLVLFAALVIVVSIWLF